jgi:hypothetical protein
MKKFLLMLGALALICSPAMAGKNANGSMVVHTDDAHGWTNGLCDLFDGWYPGITCPDLGTRTDVDVNTPALIWFLAAFDVGAAPGVSVVYFGHDHNMPQYYHNRWGYCGPVGTLEIPDGGWPDTPATAGNSVAFGSPVVGDILFPFYYFDVWGETGWYYCTAINPVGGYAGFVDDSNPPILDETDCFGCVYYGTADGYNVCPPCGEPMGGACCFIDGTCVITMDLTECLGIGGYDWLGEGTVCDPNPCPQPGACCFEDGTCVLTLDAAECTGIGGYMWMGEGIPCDPNPCPQLGACCNPDDGSCTVTLEAACPYDVWIEGDDCEPNNCPPPPPEGACCAPDGTCTVTLEPDCPYDIWYEGEVCEPNPCPPPPEGACCYGCEECIVLDQYACEDLPDDYAWYEGEVCDPNPCPPIATETTTWGSIKADYK